MKKLTTSIVFAAVLSQLIGCNLNSASDKTNNENTSTEIGGNASLINLNDSAIQNDSGITVSVDGNNLSTITNSQGNWEITGITLGTYSLVFSKAGFGTIYLPKDTVSGNGDSTINVSLYQIPSYQVSNLSDSVAVGNNVTLNINLSGNLPTGPGYSNIYVFFGLTDTVSSDTNNYSFYRKISVEPDSTHAEYQFDQSFFLSYGFTSGEKVYVVAYGGSYSAYGYGGFGTENQNSVKTLFTGLNPIPSNTVSFVIP